MNRLPKADYNRSSVAASAAVSLLYAAASIYNYYGFDVNLPVKIILFAIRGILAFLLIMHIVIPLLPVITSRAFDAPQAKTDLWRTTLLFAVIWLPFLIIKYPAAVHPDTWQGIWQFRHEAILDHQPPVFTVITGLSCKLLGNNAGIFVLAFIFYIMYCFAFGYAYTYISQTGIIPIIRKIIFFLFVSSPFTLGYIGVVVKDCPFCAAAVLITVLLLKLSRDKSLSTSQNILLFSSCVVLYCSRQNGLHILLAVILFYIIAVIRSRLEIRSLYFIIASLIFSALFSFALCRAFDVTKPANSAKEMLSVPFQQTARYVRDHPDDISDEERDIIDSVLVYDTLADRYDPRISDPVKEEYTGNKDALSSYITVWMKQFIRHPGTYLEAFWEQNRYLFSPVESASNIAFFEDTVIFYEMEAKFSCEGSWMYEPIFDEINALKGVRGFIPAYCMTAMKLPFIWITSNVGICNLVILLCWLLLLMRRDRRSSLIYYVPVLMIILISMAGPVIQGQPRYMLPSMYLMPLFLTEFLRPAQEA
ncbi:MAG: hypothetical protein J6Z43_01715 [Clostridiales bacterium]|nr:hypothetical protein [Clostridiales bacterium]